MGSRIKQAENSIGNGYSMGHIDYWTCLAFISCISKYCWEEATIRKKIGLFGNTRQYGKPKRNAIICKPLCCNNSKQIQGISSTKILQ